MKEENNLSYKLNKHAEVVMRNKKTDEIIYSADIKTSDMVTKEPNEKYYYAFLIADENENERLHKHYEQEELTEQEIMDIEEKILEESEIPIACYYIGRF